MPRGQLPTSLATLRSFGTSRRPIPLPPLRTRCASARPPQGPHGDHTAAWARLPLGGTIQNQSSSRSAAGAGPPGAALGCHLAAGGPLYSLLTPKPPEVPSDPQGAGGCATTCWQSTPARAGTSRSRSGGAYRAHLLGALRFGSACGASAAPALLPPDPPRPLGSDSLREPEPRGSPRRGHPTEWPKGGRLYDRMGMESDLRYYTLCNRN